MAASAAKVRPTAATIAKAILIILSSSLWSSEGGAGASSGFAGKAALSEAVCSRNAMIKLRRRNPVTEMAHLGSLAGSKLTRTRVSRKEWFVGRLINFTQIACRFVDCAAMGLGPGAGWGKFVHSPIKSQRTLSRGFAQPRYRSGHSPRRLAYLSPEALRAL
jgi:hypothetical protein